MADNPRPVHNSAECRKKNTAARQILREAVFLIHIKHFGNIIILRRLGQGQREEYSCFLRNQAVAGNGVGGKVNIGILKGYAAGNP
ncbi:hypothetical protein D3C80_1883930 [compost metagenome]